MKSGLAALLCSAWTFAPTTLISLLDSVSVLKKLLLSLFTLWLFHAQVG